MAKRTARSKMPLEWKTDVLRITDVTAADPSTGEFDLDLLPDEIAEIVKIDSQIALGDVTEADADYGVGMYLSMDPNADADPLDTPAEALEDLEVFFSHYYKHQQGITTSGFSGFDKSSQKVSDFNDYPVLVGTNFSQVANCIGTVDFGGTTIDALDIITTVYFKRRKASAMELNQILLKRR